MVFPKRVPFFSRVTEQLRGCTGKILDIARWHGTAPWHDTGHVAHDPSEGGQVTRFLGTPIPSYAKFRQVS